MRFHKNLTIVLAEEMMIIALKTRKLLIQIAIGEARAGGDVGLGGFLRSM